MTKQLSPNSTICHVGGGMKEGARANINLLCLVGACVGIAAMFTNWIYFPPSMPGPPPLGKEASLVFLISLGTTGTSIATLCFSAALLFTAGTLIALVSPLGGVSQVAGLLVLAVAINRSADQIPLDGITQTMRIRAGIYAGVLSAALVLISLFPGVGFGSLRTHPQSTLRLTERLLTVTISRKK